MVRVPGLPARRGVVDLVVATEGTDVVGVVFNDVAALFVVLVLTD